MGIRFLETLHGERVVTLHGHIFEKVPLLDCTYDLNIHRDSIKLFRNVTHPHHTIMWWLDGDTVMSSYPIQRFQAVFESS